VKWRRRPAERVEAHDVGATQLRVEAERGRRLVEESREFVLVLDDEERVVAASRRAREALEGLVEGARVTDEMLRSGSSRLPFRVPYEIDGRRETLLWPRAWQAGDRPRQSHRRYGPHGRWQCRLATVSWNILRSSMSRSADPVRCALAPYR